ncbi:DUF1129 domain-containing protein [Enterococcus sp. LJL99]
MGKVSIEEVNATLQKELTVENEKYYGDLLTYVRVKSIIRDNKKAEELLLDILQDILEAQKEGISAEDYFGKNPKKIADEIIRNLPINLWDTIKLALTGIGVYLLFAFIPAIFSPDKGLDIGKYLIAGVYFVILAIFLLWLMGVNLYKYNSKKKAQKIFFYSNCVIGFIGGLLIMLFVSTPLILKIGNRVGIVLILLAALVLAGLFFKEKDKQPWMNFIPMTLFFGIWGIIVRLPSFTDILKTQNGQLIFAVSLVTVVVIQYLLMFLMRKKK